MASSVAAADPKDLKPSIERVRRLIKRWSCSTILFKYFDLTVEILVGQPRRLKILLTSLMPAPFAPLLSITKRNCVSEIEVYRVQNDLLWEMAAFERNHVGNTLSQLLAQ